jgi:hypothetical protein
MLVLDGVYVRDGGGELVFHALPTLTGTEVAEVAKRTALRMKAVPGPSPPESLGLRPGPQWPPESQRQRLDSASDFERAGDTEEQSGYQAKRHTRKRNCTVRPGLGLGVR